MLPWQGCRFLGFLRWFRLQPRIFDLRLLALLEECRKMAGVRRKVVMLPVDRMRMPAVFGLLTPHILVSKRLHEELDHTELKHILLHELGHVRRYDALPGMAGSLVAMVHWFNPLVWLAVRQFSMVRELLYGRAVVHMKKTGGSRFTLTN
ncbi:MAG: Regulatory protein BlaR1 [Verrucomicrobia subdivision 3 bacterium]|nr:Regulatory protein BlaR1 [Limisphaerales bacterium]MCS1414487.1 Regulatory protein BlaR1 [Limisphaerales bacterium]